MSDEDFWEQVSEPCGSILEIDSENIMMFGSDEPVMTTPGVTLVCSRPWGHTPTNRHSDGVTDWMGEAE